MPPRGPDELAHRQPHDDEMIFEFASETRQPTENESTKNAGTKDPEERRHIPSERKSSATLEAQRWNHHQRPSGQQKHNTQPLIAPDRGTARRHRMPDQDLRGRSSRRFASRHPARRKTGRNRQHQGHDHFQWLQSRGVHAGCVIKRIDRSPHHPHCQLSPRPTEQNSEGAAPETEQCRLAHPRPENRPFLHSERSQDTDLLPPPDHGPIQGLHDEIKPHHQGDERQNGQVDPKGSRHRRGTFPAVARRGDPPSVTSQLLDFTADSLSQSRRIRTRLHHKLNAIQFARFPGQPLQRGKIHDEQRLGNSWGFRIGGNDPRHFEVHNLFVDDQRQC